MSAAVGSPFRILYESGARVSGLRNVVAYVVGADLTEYGPLSMFELPGVFAGTYFADVIIPSDASAGEYFVRCHSPSEGDVASGGVWSAVLRVSFASFGGGGGGGSASTVLSGSTNLVGLVRSATVLGSVERDLERGGEVEESWIVAQVAHVPELQGLVTDQQVDGLT